MLWNFKTVSDQQGHDKSDQLGRIGNRGSSSFLWLKKVCILIWTVSSLFEGLYLWDPSWFKATSLQTGLAFASASFLKVRLHRLLVVIRWLFDLGVCGLIVWIQTPTLHRTHVQSYESLDKFCSFLSKPWQTFSLVLMESGLAALQVSRFYSVFCYTFPDLREPSQGR